MKALASITFGFLTDAMARNFREFRAHYSPGGPATFTASGFSCELQELDSGSVLITSSNGASVTISSIAELPSALTPLFTGERQWQS